MFFDQDSGLRVPVHPIPIIPGLESLEMNEFEGGFGVVQIHNNFFGVVFSKGEWRKATKAELEEEYKSQRNMCLAEAATEMPHCWCERYYILIGNASVS